VVGAPGGGLNSAPAQYEFARRQATAEASAAARGLFEAGAQQVIVWDNHGGGVNLVYDELDERCDIFNGAGAGRFAMMDESFSGVVFVGYHSRDNVCGAPLAHTYNSSAYQWMKINGREVGELAIDAAVAGSLGVPPLMVVGDDKMVAEACEFFPGICSVQTKVGYSWNAALSKHPRRVLAEIEAAAREAVAGRGRMQPFGFAAPLEVEVRYKRLEAADAACRPSSGAVRVDAYTVKRTIGSIREFF